MRSDQRRVGTRPKNVSAGTDGENGRGLAWVVATTGQSKVVLKIYYLFSDDEADGCCCVVFFAKGSCSRNCCWRVEPRQLHSRTFSLLRWDFSSATIDISKDRIDMLNGRNIIYKSRLSLWAIWLSFSFKILLKHLMFCKNMWAKNSENLTFSYGIEWREMKEGSMKVQIATVSSLLCIEGMW